MDHNRSCKLISQKSNEQLLKLKEKAKSAVKAPIIDVPKVESEEHMMIRLQNICEELERNMKNSGDNNTELEME